MAVARKADGKVLKATQVQTAFALDDLYAYEGPLGLAFADRGRGAHLPALGPHRTVGEAPRLRRRQGRRSPGARSR